MKAQIPFSKRLVTRLNLLFLALAIVPLIMVGYLAFENGKNTIEERVFSHLVAVNLLKVGDLERWIDANEFDLEFLAQRPLVRQEAATLVNCNLGNSECQATIDILLSDHMMPALSKGDSITKLSLIRSSDGQIIVSTDPDLVGKFRENENYFVEGLKHTYTDDVTYSLSDAQAVLHLSTPVIGPNGEAIAVLAAHADLETMSDIIAYRGDDSTTEDSYLVNQFNFFVTEPRFGENYALVKSARTDGIDACLAGNTGFSFYKDYRDEPVLGAYQWLPERKMCILTELDQAEAFTPIRHLRNIIVLVGLVIGSFAIFFGVLYTRSITLPVKQLVAGAKEVGSGNLAYRIDMRRQDELGLLANSFDQMASNLEKTNLENQNLVEKLEAWSQELESRVEERTRELKAAQVATMNIMQDIEKANTSLNAEKAFTDQIINSIPGVFYVFDQHGKFLRWNKNFTAVTEYSDDEIAQMHPTQLFTGKDQAYITERIQKTFETGASDAEANFTTKGGRKIPFYFTGFLTTIEDSPYLIGTGFDITQRKQAEERLRASEERYRILAESSPDMIFVIDSEDRVEYVNSRAAKQFGKNPDLVIGQPRSALFPPAIAEEQAYSLKQVMESGELLSSESSISFPGGEIWLDTQLVPIRNKAGEIRAVMGISRDITERKRSEAKLQQLVDDLAHSNSELERFAYVASHDLQEPLRMVTSYLQLLERRYKDKLDGDALDFINYAVDGSNRMKQLILDLLAYSRVGTKGKPFEPVECEKVLESVLSNLQILIEENNATITHDALPRVMADKVQLESLFQNLVNNAIKFHGEEPPKIHIGATLQDEMWTFSVEDNGIGIDPQYFERIFIIFQRLHNREEYSGTGIGLAVSKRIVERHGGRMWIESEPGKGSTFYFSIPKSELKSLVK